MESQSKRERRKKGQFEVTFDLLAGDEQVLTIHLSCEQPQSFYTLAIDSAFIKKHSDMGSLFSTPSSLHYTLSELFEQLEISNAGIITVRLPLSAAKVKLTKIYELRMNPWPEGELEYLRTRISEQQHEFAVAMTSKQDEIAQLKAKLQKNEDIIAVMKEKLKQNEPIIKQQKERIMEVERERQQVSKELEHGQQVYLQVEAKLQDLQAQLQHKDQVIQEMKAETTNVINYQQRMLTSIYDQNPHLYHFHYAYNAKAIKVTKKSENGWSNFASGWLLHQKDPSTVNLRMNKMRDGSLAIGVGTQAVLSCSSLEHPEFVGYLCRDGRIYENGIKKFSGTSILPDQAVAITIKGPQGSVIWHIGGVEVGVASLPSSLTGKRLFLIAKVFWKEDELELYFS